MKVNLTETELIDLITEILTQINLESDGHNVSFYNLEGESELDEQDDGGEAGTSSAGEGTGTAAMMKWESGIARGVANQIGVTVDQAGYTTIGRGKANPVW